MFSTVLLRGVSDVGRSDNQLELELCRAFIHAGLPSTTPVSEVVSLERIFQLTIFISINYFFFN